MPAIQADLDRFAGLNAQVVGVNTDTIFSHIAFQKSVGGLSFPLASDRWPYAKTATNYGIFPATRHDFAFVNDRAVFIVGKEGRIAWSKLYELGEQPGTAEILEALGKLA